MSGPSCSVLPSCFAAAPGRGGSPLAERPRRPAAMRRLLRLALLLLPVVACAPQPPPPPRFGGPFAGTAPARAMPAAPARQKVALLLPLSGGNRALGEAMLNAAQLALFDQADPRVEFVPRDTGSSPNGAAEAVRSALAEGARAFAGPLTLGETSAAAGPARAAGAPVFAFTSDAAQASPGVWVLGITPAEQAERMAEVAATGGARRLGIIVPEDEFGRRLTAAFRRSAALLGLPPPVEVAHAPRAEPTQVAQLLAEKAGPDGLDAVLIGSGGAQARGAAAALATSLPRPARLLGTALWLQDATLGQEPALAGALFPGPDPAARQRFEARYLQAFGERPLPRSGLAYDGAALAARAVRDGGPGGALPPVGEALLGADGPIRLLPDGQARRGLAIFTIAPAGGEPLLVEPAPVPPGGRPGA